MLFVLNKKSGFVFGIEYRYIIAPDDQRFIDVYVFRRYASFLIESVEIFMFRLVYNTM